jgi:REP element-mobilizing transposase RayT
MIKRRAQSALEKFSQRFDQYLDAGYGACWLQRDDVACVVADALRYFDGDRYQIFSWCIMPNHVHVVVQPLTHSLFTILHSWKSYSAKSINAVLGRTGTIWQVEYFDHLIRHQEDLERCVEYTWGNPDLAGLSQWKWRWKG